MKNDSNSFPEFNNYIVYGNNYNNNNSNNNFQSYETNNNDINFNIKYMNNIFSNHFFIKKYKDYIISFL